MFYYPSDSEGNKHKKTKDPRYFWNKKQNKKTIKKRKSKKIKKKNSDKKTEKKRKREKIWKKDNEPILSNTQESLQPKMTENGENFQNENFP